MTAAAVRHDEHGDAAPATAAAVHRRPLDGGERALVVLEALVSVAGVGGGLYMASHPLTTMSVRYLEGTWFHTWRWPGLALFFFVGVCPALVVAATMLRSPAAKVGHLCVGVGLVAWILLEAAWSLSRRPCRSSSGSSGWPSSSWRCGSSLGARREASCRQTGRSTHPIPRAQELIGSGSRWRACRSSDDTT